MDEQGDVVPPGRCPDISLGRVSCIVRTQEGCPDSICTGAGYCLDRCDLKEIRS